MRRRARIQRAAKWSGMCPAGLHGLDYEGQECDVCRHDVDPANCTQDKRWCRQCVALARSVR